MGRSQRGAIILKGFFTLSKGGYVPDKQGDKDKGKKEQGGKGGSQKKDQK
jgi:hypothetical protein